MNRLIIATPLYPPEIGGPATFTKIVEEALPEKGIEVAVVKFSSVGSLPSVLRHIMFGAKVFWEARRGEVVLALDPLGIGLPALLAAWAARRPFYVRVAGDRAWEAMQGSASYKFSKIEQFQNSRHGLGVALRRVVQRFITRRAKKVIVPSEFLKRIVMMWGVRDKKVEVVYNSFEPIRVDASKEQAREALGLSGKIILSAGRLVLWKGMDGLINVMPEILQTLPGAKLLIAGEGPERKNQESRIRNQGFEKSVVFLGSLPKEILYQYIRAADIFVLNSGYEGLSHQLLEAMAIGTPIIATKIPGNEELIKDGISGLLVEYNNREQLKNAIIKLISDESLRYELSKGGYERIRDFSVERMLSKLVAILNLAV